MVCHVSEVALAELLSSIARSALSHDAAEDMTAIETRIIRIDSLLNFQKSRCHLFLAGLRSVGFVIYLFVLPVNVAPIVIERIDIERIDPVIAPIPQQTNQNSEEYDQYSDCWAIKSHKGIINQIELLDQTVSYYLLDFPVKPVFGVRKSP